MSTMPAQHGHSQACCNVPPVVTKDYQGKGSYEQVGGLKTYVTGPSDATKAIVVVFDIFGYYPQTVQGADILATSGAEKYRVFVPDWFHGEPCPLAWYPPDTEEKQKNLGAFFQKNPPGGVAEQLPGYVGALRAANPSVTGSVGAVGMCWGGKAVALAGASRETNPFAALAQVHPAMVDPADAQTAAVPVALLASKDEDAGAVAKFDEALKVPKHVETFADQIHGWMGARGDLEDERVRAEYVRGYETVLGFFGKHL